MEPQTLKDHLSLEAPNKLGPLAYLDNKVKLLNNQLLILFLVVVVEGVDLPVSSVLLIQLQINKLLVFLVLLSKINNKLHYLVVLKLSNNQTFLDKVSKIISMGRQTEEIKIMIQA